MMTGTCINSMQSSSLVSTPACSRKAFSGTAVPLLPQKLLAKQKLRSITPRALFTRNKSKKSTKPPTDKGAKEVDPLQPAFTRRREAFAGRLAMFGFAASLIGEIASGKGVLGQLSLETGLSTGAIEASLLAFIGYNAFSALRPGSPTFSESNQRDVKKRQKGPNQNPKINVTEPKKFLGITEFGFSKKNEIFVGRTAQLGFLASIIGEKITGKGPLGQFGIETGVPISQVSFGLIAFIAFFLVAAVFEGNYGDKEKEDYSQY